MDAWKQIAISAIPVIAGVSWGLVNHWQEMKVTQTEIAALRLDLSAAILRVEKIESLQVEVARLQGTFSGMSADLNVLKLLRFQRRGLTEAYPAPPGTGARPQ